VKVNGFILLLRCAWCNKNEARLSVKVTVQNAEPAERQTERWDTNADLNWFQKITQGMHAAGSQQR